MLSPLELALLKRQPKPIGAPLPLPTEDKNPSTSKSIFEGGIDALLGVLGVGPQTKANLVGQLGMAALPVAGGVKALRGTLAMDEASRMARAAEQGYTQKMYHGTISPKDFGSFRPAVSRSNNQDFGIHVTPNPETADNLFKPLYDKGADDYAYNARIIPALVKMNKTLETPDMNQWHNPREWLRRISKVVAGDLSLSPTIKTNDPETLQAIHNLAKQYAITSTNTSLASNNVPFQQDLKSLLQNKGYDSISYPNMFETTPDTRAVGERSYLLLDQRQARSPWARFDPTKTNSKDLLASLLAATGIGTVAAHSQDK